MTKPIFRKEVLDRMSSPEQLDQAIVVTSARSWIGLAGAGLLVLVGLIWGVFGSIPTRVAGEGIISFGSGEFMQVSAVGSARLNELLVGSGDSVQEGESIVKLTDEAGAEALRAGRQMLETLRDQRSDLVRQLQQEQEERAEVTERHRQALNFNLATLERRVEALEVLAPGGPLEETDVQAASFREQLSNLDERIRFLAEDLEAQEALVEEGIVAPRSLEDDRESLLQARLNRDQALVQIDDTLTSARQTIGDLRGQIEDLRLTELQARHAADQNLASMDDRILTQENQVRSLELQLGRIETLRS